MKLLTEILKSSAADPNKILEYICPLFEKQMMESKNVSKLVTVISVALFLSLTHLVVLRRSEAVTRLVLEMCTD